MLILFMHSALSNIDSTIYKFITFVISSMNFTVCFIISVVATFIICTYFLQAFD